MMVNAPENEYTSTNDRNRPNSPGRKMGLFKAFDTREITEFATQLALDMNRRFPPASESRTDAGATHQLKVILEGLSARAVRFHAEQKLGIYKKAKLGNVFRWKLSELGYSPEFVERATKELITKLAVK
jgi:hypothetical protein